MFEFFRNWFSRDADCGGRRSHAVRGTRLTVESLEDRRVLTSFAAPWPEPSQFSLSFAPDGAEVGTQASMLYAALDAVVPTKVWQEEILKAFQTWAVNTNINIGLVPDGGQPLGSLGLKQGDARFGDIRIAAIPLGSDIVAAADPYDPFVANSWVGDVFLNLSNTLGPAGTGADYDLFSVVLHEAGHVFGLSHSDAAASPMFPLASSQVLQSPTAADIAALQTLYGARSEDAFDAVASNDVLSQAATLAWEQDYSGGYRATAIGDISTQSDVDHFQFSLPQIFGSTEVRLHAAGVSLLTARISLMDSTGRVLTAQEAVDPLNNDVVLSVPGLVTGESYFIRVEGARSDVFGIGGYELSVCELPTSAASPPAEWSLQESPPTDVEFTAMVQSAIAPRTTPGYVEHTYYEEYGNITAQRRSQVVRVRSADIDSSINNVFTVLVTTPKTTTGPLQLRILDEFGRVQSAVILHRADGAIEVQIPSVASNRDYFIEISSHDSNLTEAEFEVTVDFDQDGGHLQNYVSDTLPSEVLEAYRRFVVVESGQFHFVLSASDYDADQASGLQMTVRDGNGRIVMQWSVRDGQARAGDFFFQRGTYVVEFTRVDASSRHPVVFQLAGLSVSDPIGPQLRDTVLEPVDVSANVALAGVSAFWLPFKPVEVGAPPQNFAILGFGVASRTASGPVDGGAIRPSSIVAPQTSPATSAATGESRVPSSDPRSSLSHLRGSSGKVVKRITTDPKKATTEIRDTSSQKGETSTEPSIAPRQTEVEKNGPVEAKQSAEERAAETPVPSPGASEAEVSKSTEEGSVQKPGDSERVAKDTPS